jgi:hypothetical protein
MIKSFFIDYQNESSILCEIGKKYDTDKSSQRLNPSNTNYCHPYTLFYNNLFKNKRNENLTIAELGILNGASLQMWNDYFPNSKIYGFELHISEINKFNNRYKYDRISLIPLDVRNSNNITSTFSQLGVKFDFILDDTSHEFEDQINIIKHIHPYIKDGGLLIIEDIFLSRNEQDYIDSLGSVLDNFSDYYFVTLDHVNKNSYGWDNDKLFILIKNGNIIFN